MSLLSNLIASIQLSLYTLPRSASWNKFVNNADETFKIRENEGVAFEYTAVYLFDYITKYVLLGKTFNYWQLNMYINKNI